MTHKFQLAGEDFGHSKSRTKAVHSWEKRSHFQAAGSSLLGCSSTNPLDIAAKAKSRNTKSLIDSLVKLMSLLSPEYHVNEHSNKEGYIKPITHQFLDLPSPATIPLVFSGGPGKAKSQPKPSRHVLQQARGIQGQLPYTTHS